MSGDDAKRKRWERVTVWPGIAASVAFLIAYSCVVLAPTMPRALAIVLLLVLAVVWVFFALDFMVRLVLAEHKLSFIRHNPVDLASVFLPVARPFRLLYGLARVPLFRGNSPSRLRRRVLVIAGTFVLMFIYVIALAVYNVERSAPGSNIHSFGDAVWWACVTMATVGYGDYYPVTVAGRLLAVVLMIGGIVIVGTSSATIVSFLNERTQQVRRRPEPDERYEDREDRRRDGDQPGGDGTPG